MLAQRGLPATLFVPVGFVAGEEPAPITGTGHLRAASWSELGALAEAGVEIGSHSWSHAELPSLPDGRLRDELARSRARLEEELHRPVTSFCYPRAIWSPRVESRVAETYTLATVAGGRRLTRRTLHPHRLPRVPVRRDGPASLRPLLAAPVWLEEWIADRVRRLARLARRRTD